MPFQRPPSLSPGDSVAVIAPAGPFDRAAFEKGLEHLASRYHPRFDEGLFSKHRYLAGTDERRRTELLDALRDPSIKALFAARGGYGCMRLLPSIAFDTLPPKLVVGFSDVTALHFAANTAGWTTLHAPVLTQLGKQPPEVLSRFFHLLESTAPAPPLTGGKTLIPGVAEGPLLGGNFTVAGELVGTPYVPPLDGCLLLLEDIGERPYRLDRMWTHFRLSGLLDRVAGLVLGDFTGCEEAGAPYSSLDVLHDLAAELGVPCATGFPIGHGAINHPVPLGARARLDATAGRLEFLEPLVSSKDSARSPSGDGGGRG